MIVYGKNVFSQLQEDPSQILEIYIQEGFRDKKILASVFKNKLKSSTVSKAYLDRLTERGIHQGIAARVKEIPMLSVSELLSKAPENGNGFYLALDEIQDPHNLGAIFRTADAAGVNGIVMTKHNSASFTPAAIKASTGAAYTVPAAAVANLSQTIDEFKENGYWVVAADVENARDYRQGIYDVPLLLVIGNEGKGISRNVRKHCDYSVSIPMYGSVQSLNASVAAGILMFEAAGQRHPLEAKTK